MRYTIFLVMVALVLIVGCAQSPEIKELDEVVQREVVEKKEADVMEKDVEIEKDVTLRNVIMDRNKYITGGREGYDTAKVFFTQNAGKGYEVEVDGDTKQIEVELMTDANCAFLDREQEFEIISSKIGANVKLVSSGVEDEDRNICIHLKAVDDGEITAHIITNELVF